MKALDEYILVVLFVLLLKRVHFHRMSAYSRPYGILPIETDNLESRREQQRHLHFVGTLFYLVSKQTRFVAFLRRHIVKERGVVEIESLMFDEHELIKRAATECMCNMILCEEVSSSPAYRPLARP